MELFDSHLHLPHELYHKPVELMINEAQSLSVCGFVCIGTDLKSSKGAIEIADRFPGVYASIGIYPHDEKDKNLTDLKTELEKLLESSNKIVAIGECGIDISNMTGGRNLAEQKELFKMQTELAQENHLPIVIHNRNGHSEVMEVLQTTAQHKEDLGVMHCFTGTWEQAQEYISYGLLISFSGIVTYPSGTTLFETVQKIPNDKFLIETDSPYLAPQSVRKEVNEPKYVKMTAQKIADLKGTSVEKIAEYSTANAKRLFKI